jgi:hypothetical protein
MTRRTLLLVSLALLVPLFTAPAFAQTAIGATTGAIYRLTPASSYLNGCFDPCTCPVQLKGGLIGAFRMMPAPPDPLYRVFNISDLNWFVPEFGTWVTGSGTYKVGGEVALMQELSLDLKVGDLDVQHFDSGLVAGGADFPSIDLTVSMNNMVCHDTVFHVAALPVPPIEIQPYTLYGSSYEEGCFGPCACAITSKPVAGRFGLLRIAGADATSEDFAVVNVQWLVRDPVTPTATAGSPVIGGGLYHVGLAAQEQEMRLNLLENGAGPTRFDSGAVPWKSPLRRIDIDVAANGFACDDRVYSIHAKGHSAAAAVQLTHPEPYNPGVSPSP